MGRPSFCEATNIVGVNSRRTIGPLVLRSTSIDGPISSETSFVKRCKASTMRDTCADVNELRGKVAFAPIGAAPLGESHRDGTR